MCRRSAAALSTHILYIPMIHYVHWLKSVHLTLTHMRAHRQCTLILCCALYEWGLCFLAVRLFEDERLLGLSTHLWLKPFETHWQMRVLAHTHTHTHTHARTLSHTAMHFHFKHSFPFPARSWCAFLRNTCKDGRHKWHLTCLNRLAVHSTTSLDVGGFVCTLVPVRWPISWSKLPEWFGPGNTLVVVVFFVFLCPLLIISPITLSLQPFLGWHIRSVPPPQWGSFD